MAQFFYKYIFHTNVDMVMFVCPKFGYSYKYIFSHSCELNHSLVIQPLL